MADPARHPEALLRAVYEAAVDAFITIDDEGTIRAVNPACERLFGYAPSEMLGRNVKMLMPSPYREEHDDYIRRFLKTGERRIIGIGREVEARHAQGRIFPIHLAVSEVHVADTGRLFTGIVRDISDLKAAQARVLEEEAKAQRYFDIAAVILLVLDAEGRVQRMNRIGCEALGVREDEALGLSFCESFVGAEGAETFAATLERFAEVSGADSAYFECSLNPRGEGGERLYSWHHTALRDADGQLTGSLGCGADITELRAMTRQLVERESLARLGEMTAVVAHEVKNPIAGISGALRILSGRVGGEAGAQEIVDEVLARLESLNAIVNDMLLFSKPQLPRRARLPVRLLVDHCVALLREDPEVAQVALAVEGSEELTILADRQQLTPVFSNLIINAAHAAAGRVEVRVAAEGEWCAITVDDDGPGVAPELRARLFEPFFTTKSRGTGLGLAIAKRTAELHGGQVELGDGPLGGARFTVRLPLGE